MMPNLHKLNKAKGYGILDRLHPRRKVLSDFYTLDVETGERKENGAIQFGFLGQPEGFIYGVIYGHNHCRVFTDLKEMNEALKEKRYKNKFVFGHNIPYDLNTLHGSIFNMDKAAIFNGTRFITATNGNCKFGDSMNILGRIKLGDIGSMIGIEKPSLGDDNQYAKDGLTPAIINRCIEDCRITYEALFQVFNKAGDIKLTGPSLALSNFRRYFMSMAIAYKRNVIEFFASYYGGRTEAFKIGPTHANVIDVNSMYPFIMKVCKFPNPKFLNVFTIVTPEQFLKQLLPNFEGMAQITVKHKPHFFGFLPWKNNEGKLMFPIGTFSGTWTFPEIRLAVAHGVVEVLGVTRVVCGPAMPTPFEKYVDHYYEIKQTSDNKFEIDRVKHLLNDLYGKFAQREADDTRYIDDIEIQAEHIKELYKEFPDGELKLFNTTRKDAFFVCGKNDRPIPHQIPSFAAYITANARVHLLKEMLRLKDKGVVYCDTDSIFFEYANDFESSKRLGDWKLEPKIITQIRGLKNYTYFMTTGKNAGVLYHRIKGIPKKARQVEPTEKELIRMITGKGAVFEYDNLLNTKEALRRSLKPGISTKRRKVVTGKYEKRLVYDDGTTAPIAIGTTI